MKVTLQQLAWWLERDGWRYLRSTGAGNVYGKPGQGEVEVPDAQVAELDALRDRVYTQLRDKALAQREQALNRRT
jgi:hypothetical protein